jgi:curved DNA-binding protein CbpA
VKDYYTTLGVARNATKKEIRDAYLELAKEWHPDHLPREGQWTLVNEKFAEITEAYQLLTDDKKRLEYDMQLKRGVKRVETQDTAGRIQAERAFRNGLEEYRKEKYTSAQAFFKAAARLDPNVPKYKSYQGLAQAHTGYRMSEAVELCEGAIKSEMYNSELYVNVAIVYKMAGRIEESKKKLAEALKWNSDNKRAAEMLAEMNGKKGIFGRILGRGGTRG